MGAATAVAALVLALAGDPAAGVRTPPEARTVQAEYTVTPQQKLEFERDGVTMLRNVVPDIKDFAGPLRLAWTQGVREFAYEEARRIGCPDRNETASFMAAIPPPERVEFEEGILEGEIAKAIAALRGVEDCSEVLGTLASEGEESEGSGAGHTVKYFQALNLHRFNTEVGKWALGGRLASAAAQLLGSDVRLYQDAFFRKGDAAGQRLKIFSRRTSIHEEGTLIPVDVDKYVTAWCPLRRADPRKQSVLFFFPGSHRARARRRLQPILRRSVYKRAGARDQKIPEDYFAALRLLASPDYAHKLAFGDQTVPDLEEGTRVIMEKFCARVTQDGRAAEPGAPRWPGERRPHYWWPVPLAGEVGESGRRVECMLSADGRVWVERVSEKMQTHVANALEEAKGNGTEPELHLVHGMELFRKALQADMNNFKLFWGQNGGAFDYGVYEVGDCSMHHGETLHAAPASPRKMPAGEEGAATSGVREAVSLSYVAKEARKVPATVWESLFSRGGQGGSANEDYLSYSRWWYKVSDDAELGSPTDPQDDAVEGILPVVWPQATGTDGVAPPRPDGSPIQDPGPR